MRTAPRGPALRCAATALLTIAPALGQWGPIQAANAPSPRSEALMAFDLSNLRMLLFGGNLTNEFWAFDGAAWTQLTPAVLPPARRRAGIAADMFTGEITLYGGQNGTSNTALDDTWLWDGVAWQQLSPSNSPGGLMWHGMCFDTTRNVAVAFGGRRNIFNPNEYLDETWEFSRTANTWTQVFVPQNPPPLHRPAMCEHPGLNVSILFGGEDATGQATDETWLFDGSSWTRINQTGVAPPPRAGAALVPVLNRGIVVLFGGRDPVTFEILNDTWEHDGTQWREITNVYGGIYPARGEAAVAHDFARDRIVAFGGEVDNGALRQDTWEYGAQWQPFGIGCAGTAGVPSFTGTTLPRLGTTAEAEIGNVPAGVPVAFVAVGLSRTQWAGGSLPALLTPIGMTGCRAYTSADLITSAPALGGVATWSFAIPSVPALVGEAFHLQGITWDPGANPFGLATSNAATLVVGN